MRLAISNIAWTKEQDESMYAHLQQQGFLGLEVAPTRLFSEKPYAHIAEASLFRQELKSKYNLVISSMQSIWYGKKELIVGSKNERQILLDYTFRAIDFAEALGCKNIVFGCPKNRVIKTNEDYKTCILFFRKIGNYALQHHTVVSLEANPVIYGTNFLNYTKDAINFCRQVDNAGIAVNYDLGTVIFNDEDYNFCLDNLDLINHVHISEPNLVKINKRNLHKDFFYALRQAAYNKFISIEMKTMKNVKDVYETIEYIRNIV